MRLARLNLTIVAMGILTSYVSQGFLSQAFAGTKEDAGDITVTVDGLRNSNGVVRIALFNSPESYSKGNAVADGAVQKVIAPIQGKGASAVLPNVPYGEYAIKCFHDEDNSGRFLTNRLGIPKVEYGFSNNARGFLGPAPFDKAKFNLDQKRLDMTIKVQH